MVSRVLAVPAILCLALGAVLGVWGWGERDAARARIIPEQEEVVVGGGTSIFAPSFDEQSLEDQTCEVLRAASRVEPPYVGPTGPDGSPSSLDPNASAALTSTLLAVLDPVYVAGIPGLDRIDLTTAMAAQRDAVERVQQRGGDVTTDRRVEVAGQELGRTLDEVC